MKLESIPVDGEPRLLVTSLRTSVGGSLIAGLRGTPRYIGWSIVIGLAAIAAFVVGHMARGLNTMSRVLMAFAGIALLHQGLATDIAGLTVLLAVRFIHKAPGSKEAGARPS